MIAASAFLLIRLRRSLLLLTAGLWALLAVRLGAAPGEPTPSDADATLAARAWEESARPVRPGGPDGAPFWNGAAVQFLYAPAFAAPVVPGAQTYRFTVTPAAGGARHFAAPQPWAPLAPVWRDLPVGKTELTIEALDAGGRKFGMPWRRTFHRAAPFAGGYPPAAMPWAESAALGLRALVHSPDLRCWFDGKEPDEPYHLYRYPSKIIAAAAAALALYAGQEPAPTDRDAAYSAARRAADYLLSLRFPASAAWAWHVPTYHTTRFQSRLKGHMTPENYMTNSGADSGRYLLIVHAVTGDARYLEAAIRIAETYARHQRPDGSWPLLVRSADGHPVADNIMVPTQVVEFLDRLERAAGKPRFNSTRDRAVAWIAAQPVRTWNWQGQFEDVKPLPPYENLTKHDACDFALHLLQQSSPTPADLALALDLVRFAEDQFVIWGLPPEETPGRQSADGVAGAKPRRWLVPCVLEQYRCYAPVCASSAKLIRVFLAAHRVTHDPLHLAKARALAATLTRTQATPRAPGRFLTWVMQPTGAMWFNCELMAVQALQELAAADPNSA